MNNFQIIFFLLKQENNDNVNGHILAQSPNRTI